MKLNTRSPFYKQYTGAVTIDSTYGEVVNDEIITVAIKVDSTQDIHKVSNDYIKITDANT